MEASGAFYQQNYGKKCAAPAEAKGAAPAEAKGAAPATK
jgi:hypothetical protein